MDKQWGFSRVTLTWLLLAAVLQGTLAADWSYSEQSRWPGVCNADGHRQSPINLQRDRCQVHSFTDFEFKNYAEKYRAAVTNDGHTVKVQLLNAQPPLTIRGGGLPYEYVVDSLHFHWESEHTFHSNRFPLEMHIVHYANIYNSTSAALNSKNPQALAVLGVLFDLAPVDNPSIDTFVESLEVVGRRAGSSNEAEGVSFKDLLPKDVGTYFRYEGSLTTPNCDEVVIWTVFYQVNYISKRQLAYFTSVRSSAGTPFNNYRELQKVNDRVVTFVGGYSAAAGLAPSGHALFILSLLSYLSYKQIV